MKSVHEAVFVVRFLFSDDMGSGMAGDLVVWSWKVEGWHVFGIEGEEVVWVPQTLIHIAAGLELGLLGDSIVGGQWTTIEKS